MAKIIKARGLPWSATATEVRIYCDDLFGLWKYEIYRHFYSDRRTPAQLSFAIYLFIRIHCVRYITKV